MAEVEEGQALTQEKEELQEKEDVTIGTTEVEGSTDSTTIANEVAVENGDEVPASEESSEVTEQEVPEEQEPDEPKPVLKLETAPADIRFPTTNQSRHCYTRYIEYHRCIAAKGKDAPECEKFAKYYRSLCPGEWIERWNEQRENGTFPGPL